MISAFALQRVAVILVAGKFYKSCIRTISKNSSDSVVKTNIVTENDMVRMHSEIY